MIVWSLFDGSGIMGLPWAEAGHTVYCFNADDADHGDYAAAGAKVSHSNIRYVNAWLDEAFISAAVDGVFGSRPDIVFAFPPCTDLAVSGAAHFEQKKKLNPDFQIKAVETCRVAQRLADVFGVPYMIENPVSVLSTMWRRPDHTFHPYAFGGFLPEDDRHPFFPEIISPRDAYQKKTCLWVGGGFIMPPSEPVAVPSGYSARHNRLGGRSARTKTIRSLTPRGFARAVFEANK